MGEFQAGGGPSACPPGGGAGMTVRVADVLEAVDRRAPFHTAAAWDAAGLQIGSLRRPVSKAAVAHELTGPVVEQVLALGVDLVLSYHPLVFRPLRSVTAGPGPEGRAFALLEGRVSVIAVHTNWDAAPGGASDALAEALGLYETEGFAAYESAGGGLMRAGRCGRFDGAAADLTRAVQEALGVRPRTAGLAPDRPVRTAAVLPGSGGAHLDDALAAGADVYVTGDLSHHEARRGMDGGMGLVDAGHGPTERPGVRALYSFAADAGIAAEVVDLAGVDDTPWED